MITHYTFIDAEHMHAQYPNSFLIPNNDDIIQLCPGDYIKVGVEFDPTKIISETPKMRALWQRKVGQATANNVNRERFWVMLRAVGGDSFNGVINNDLVYTAHHGLKDGQVITVQRQHILDIQRL